MAAALMGIVLLLAAAAAQDQPDAATEVVQAPAPPPAMPPASTPLERIPDELRPSIKSWVEGEKKEVGLGQTLEMQVVVERRPGDAIHLPADTSFGSLELIDRNLETKQGEEGRVIDSYRLVLLALVPGETEIPALRFGGVLEGGEVVHLDTHPRRITVTDPTAGATDDVPREIAPVRDVYQQDYTLLYVLGGLLALVLVVLLVRYLVRNWAKWHPIAALAPPPPRPPEEVALEKLHALREAGFPDGVEKKRWYIELSEIMREYVGGRYDFDGLESTTEEIIILMRGRKTAGLTQAELFRFLNECDMVKFAKFMPASADDEVALSEAFRIVQLTTPEKPTTRPGERAGGGA